MRRGSGNSFIGDETSADAGTFVLNSRSCPQGTPPMNERQTLSLLGWTLGTVVAVVFILNGIALSMP
jgi:hypothetical protein